jgi:anaerobic magnesium-protoporphyrin IX monomethyl ester cyclase
MKIILANPPCRIEVNNEWERYFVRSGSRWPFSVLKRKTDRPEYVPFPFYLAYTAGLLEKEGFDVNVIDAIALNLSTQDFIAKVKAIIPDIMLFETSTPTIEYDLDLIRHIRNVTNSIIVLTGTHATVFPKEVMSEDNIDYIIRGEYELSFLDLVRKIKSGVAVDAFRSIKGLVFRQGSSININNDQELIDPLDQLPFPSFHLFPVNDKNDLSLYWDGFCQNKPAIQLHSSRGCPFRCNFCLWNQVMYGNGKYRTFSPGRAVDEMEFVIKNFNAREIYFDDDSFTIDKNHVLQICAEIKKRNLQIQWSCMADAICLDLDMINAMADSGCIGIKFGVESAEAEILKKIGKPLNYDKLKALLKICIKRKIKTHVTFTFGLSGENMQTMQKTLQFAQSLDVDSVQFSITTPFPGTRYYDELKEKGMLKANKWSDYDGSGKSVVKYRELTSEQVENFCRCASTWWLRHKLNDFNWLRRQLYNLNRVRKGQGFVSLFKRILRFFQLIRI